MGMVVLLATSYLHISLLAYILDQFWPVQNFYHFFKKENSCLSGEGGGFNKTNVIPFYSLQILYKKDIFPMVFIQNKDFKFPCEKKQEVSRKQIHGG